MRIKLKLVNILLENRIGIRKLELKKIDFILMKS